MHDIVFIFRKVTKRTQWKTAHAQTFTDMTFTMARGFSRPRWTTAHAQTLINMNFTTTLLSICVIP